MTAKHPQLSLADIFKDCQDIFASDKPAFFSLLEEYINFEDFIPQTFCHAFYQKLGRKREYPLTAFLSALILQKIISIPTDSLLILLLHLLSSHVSSKISCLGLSKCFLLLLIILSRFVRQLILL